MSSEADFSAEQFRQQDTISPAAEPLAASRAQAVPQIQAAPQVHGSVQFSGSPQAQGVPHAVLPKNPALGVILSFFIPGVGSMVNGDAMRGVIILAVYVVGWFLAFFLIGIPILFGAWVWGLVDGYLSAQRWNLAHGIVS
jgi:TM2 domain-containing membrane protein YozV